MMNYRLNQLLLVLSTLIMVSACGGGGGSSSSSSDDGLGGGSDPAMPAQVGGNAVKGIVIKGNVSARELDSAGAVLRVVGTAVTGSDGGYNLTLDASYQGGPIEIVLSSGPDTTTVCDVGGGCGNRTDGLTSADDPDNDDDLVIDFGEEYKPANLSMTALLGDAQNGETIEVQVTPYTHLAAQRAKSAPLTAASIDSANSEVSVLLGGIDILRTTPVDITNPASLNAASAFDITYSGLSAAIAMQAPVDANHQPEIDQALADLSTGYAASGLFLSDDLQVILDNTDSALATVGVTDTTGVLASVQAVVDDAAGGPIDPQPNPNVGDSDVQKTRLFLSDLRTWGTVIDQELDAPSQAFATQVELAQAATDIVLNDDAAFEAIVAGLEVIAEIFDTGSECATGSPCVFTDKYTDHGIFAGQVTRSASNEHSTYSISNASVTVAGKVATLDLVVIVPDDLALLSTITVGVESAVADSDNARVVVNSGIVVPTSRSPVLIDYYDQFEDGDDDIITMVVLDLDVAITQKKILVNGIPQIAIDPVTFAGKLGLTAYTYIDPVNDTENGDLLPGSIELDGTISNSMGDSVEARVTVSIPTAAADAANPAIALPLDSTYAENNGGSHLIAWTRSADEFTYFNPEEFYSFTFNVGSVHVEINSPFAGYVDFVDPGTYASLDDYFNAKGPFMPFDPYYVSIDGQGSYSRDFSFPDYSQSGFVTFRLDEPDVVFYDASKPPIGSVGLQFSAQFVDLPEALVNITGSTTGFEQGTATVTLSFDNRMIRFSGSNNTAGGDIGSFDITNQDGVVLTLDFDNEVFSDLSINGRVIATVEELGSGAIKVSYIDGTFEIF